MKIVLALSHTESKNYELWYAKLDQAYQIESLLKIDKESLIKELFQDYATGGKSSWEVLQKKSGNIEPIELTDFVSMNTYSNTHFGDLPTTEEFNEVLHHLNINLKLEALAS